MFLGLQSRNAFAHSFDANVGNFAARLCFCSNPWRHACCAAQNGRALRNSPLSRPAPDLALARLICRGVWAPRHSTNGPLSEGDVSTGHAGCPTPMAAYGLLLWLQASCVRHPSRLRTYIRPRTERTASRCWALMGYSRAGSQSLRCRGEEESIPLLLAGSGHSTETGQPLKIWRTRGGSGIYQRCATCPMRSGRKPCGTAKRLRFGRRAS